MKENKIETKELPAGRRSVGYRFYRRDPMLDDVVALLLDYRRSGKSLQYIANTSGVSITTLHNWIRGVTFRPQRITMEFVLRAMGKTLVIVDSDNIVSLLPKRKK